MFVVGWFKGCDVNENVKSEQGKLKKAIEEKEKQRQEERKMSRKGFWWRKQRRNIKNI